ncbi:MAG: YceH family protein [Calditrichia bacterium]
MNRTLNQVEVRILGCLIEKESTTPEYYPLSLNALKNACNQKSNRYPVVNWDDATVVEGIKSLQREELVLVASGAGQRVRKYIHKFSEKYFVSRKALAVMCVLMLRGSQTVGEIRTRSERIYSFESLEEVSEALEELMERDQPLIVRLPRRPGQKESRYAHLLSGEPEIPVETFPETGASDTAIQSQSEVVEKLVEQVENLQQELQDLKKAFETFKAQFE